MDQQIFTTQNLRTRGYTHDMIRRACADGSLVRLRRGRFRRPRVSDGQPLDAWPTDEAEHLHRLLLYSALPLALGTVASHQTAAILHGLPVPARELGVLAMLRPGAGQGYCSRTRRLRQAHLPDTEVVDLSGIAATSFSRTVLDLARTLPFPDAVAVTDAALRRDPDAAESVRADLLGRLRQRRHHGNPAARRAVLFADPRAESPGESRCRATFELAGIPIPRLQLTLQVNGEFVARTDFGWEEHRVVGEYDGRQKYGSDPGAVLTREKAREDRIRELGWRMIRFVSADLRDPD
ncbi:hypothetical protein [Granulicoccus phenolivorans]|uniref:hypothetical protein n=1 Tax=Granulicoccus phenolivorans TaxID=266854 RepID=UPI000687DC6A|nr:hypothetical protein [Granulicoccus phenolivorans]